MISQFKDKTALITGAASGIGAATAAVLAAGGATLLLADIQPIAGNALIGDVSDPDFWASAALPPLDLAVINAGVSAAGAVTDMDFSEWRRILSVNLDGAFLSLQAAMRAMKDGGSIVLVSSATAIKAEIGTAAYGASKAGMLQLMRVAAKEGAARRIRVNAIAPAGVETPMWSKQALFADLAEKQGSEQAAYTALAGGTPLGRFATAEEIAGQIAFLLSDAAATITGATLTSDGGYLL